MIGKHVSRVGCTLHYPTRCFGTWGDLLDALEVQQ
jgi:hypothetical protein